MNINALPLNGSTRDAAVNKIVIYLKQGKAELPTGLIADSGKTLEASIKSLKDSLSKTLNSYTKGKSVAESADKLAASIFETALYRDTKYSSANRKYLFGLGYHNAMVHSARTVFSKKQLELNTK